PATLKQLKSVDIAAWLAKASHATRSGRQIDRNAPEIVIARSAPRHRKVAGRYVGIELIVLVNNTRDHLKVVGCRYSRQVNTQLHNAMAGSADGRMGTYLCHVDHGTADLSLAQCCKSGS